MTLIWDWLNPFNGLRKQHEAIVMKLEDLDEALAGLGTQLSKVKDEILAKLDDLSSALENVVVPDEAVVALDALAATIQALDDVVPEATPPEEPPAA